MTLPQLDPASSSFLSSPFKNNSLSSLAPANQVVSGRDDKATNSAGDMILTRNGMAWGMKTASGEVYDLNGDRGYTVQYTLTAADKALVKQTTGWDIDADPDGKTASTAAFEFAGRLNLDRASRSLTGPITKSYLDTVIKQQYSGQNMVPISTLLSAEANLAQATRVTQTSEAS